MLKIDMYDIKEDIDFEPNNMYLVQSKKFNDSPSLVLVTDFIIQSQKDGVIFLNSNSSWQYSNLEYLKGNYTLIKKVDSIKID